MEHLAARPVLRTLKWRAATVASATAVAAAPLCAARGCVAPAGAARRAASSHAAAAAAAAAALPNAPPMAIHPASGLVAPYEVAVVGAPMSYGQPLAGTELAPAAVRAAGLAAVVTSLGWRYSDLGDVDIPAPTAADADGGGGPVRNAAAVAAASQRIYAATRAAASAGKFVLTLGGDHSVAAGSVAGVLHARPRLGVVWVDAHADVNTPGTSPSGNAHGMPLSFLLRRAGWWDPVAAAPAQYGWLGGVPRLPTGSLVYVGLRDVDAGEKAAIRAAGIRAFTMRDIDRYGIGRVMAMAAEALAEDAGGAPRPLHLSLDIDAVDPSIAPSTGTAVPGGLSYREAHYIAEALAEAGTLGSMDLVEINPALGVASGTGAGSGGGKDGWAADGDGAAAGAAAVAGGGGGPSSSATVRLGLELVASALGKAIL